MKNDFDSRNHVSSSSIVPLIGEIYIEPAGTAMIAVHADTESSWERALYGDTCAFITVYNVKFKPVDPSQIEALADEVNKALVMVAEQTPDFYEPYPGYQGIALKRGDYARQDRHYIRPSKWQTSGSAEVQYENTRGDIKESGSYVQVGDVLDLDDIWRLYHALGDLIEPNAQIAQAMYQASILEGRGPLLSYDDLNPVYEYNITPENEVGCYVNLEAAEIFNARILDIARERSLADDASDAQADRDFVMQLASLAADTLTGQINAPEEFPTLARLLEGGTQIGKTGRELYQERIEALVNYILAGSEMSLDGSYLEKIQGAGVYQKSFLRKIKNKKEIYGGKNCGKEIVLITLRQKETYIN